jgi:tRNA(Ile)-lysidine synthase
LSKDLLPEVRSFIAEHNMLSRGDRVLVAVSGGPDSTALLHLLYRLREDYRLALHIFHLHHGMRAEADMDAAFVADLARRLELPFHGERRNIPQMIQESGGSSQLTARKVRYELAFRLAEEHSLNKIALGHNADDQGETVLMRFLTGGGLRGLAGIPPVRGKIIRPLLGTFRRSIEEYCRAMGLAYRIDASNLKPTYLRNRIRLQLIPYLEEEYNPRLRERLASLADILRGEGKLLEELDRELYRVLARPQRDGSLGLDLEGFLALSTSGQRRVLIYALEKLKAPRFDADHIENVRALAHGSRGKTVHLPGGFWAARDYEVLALGQGGRKTFQARNLPVPGMVAIGELWIRADLIPVEKASIGSLGKELGESCAEFDWDAIVPPLVVRPRALGDRIEPLGLGGSKKVKDILIEGKVPRRLREMVPIIADAEGILWVGGLRRSERGRIGEGTRRVLRLQIEGLEQLGIQARAGEVFGP